MSYLINSFQVPNFLVDDLIQKMSPNGLRCYLVIIRKTIGWAKEFDAISATQFIRYTGIKDKKTVFKVLAELEGMNLIQRKSKKGVPTLYKVVTIYKNQDLKLKITHTKNWDDPKKGSGVKNGTHKTHVNNIKVVNREKDVLSTSFYSYLGREVKVDGDVLMIDKISTLKNQKLEILTTSKNTNQKMKAELKKEELLSLLEGANV